MNRPRASARLTRTKADRQAACVAELTFSQRVGELTADDLARRHGLSAKWCAGALLEAQLRRSVG